MTMPFEYPLIEAKLVKRYKRFFADAVLSETSQEVTSHCPNTGSMKSCGSEGDTILLSHHDDPKRKLKYTWQFTVVKDGFVGVNTHLPNKVVKWFVENNSIDLNFDFVSVKPEKKYGEQNSKIDLYLEDKDGVAMYVEIKNVTLLQYNKLMFPDAVTTRGQKHLEELTNLKKNDPNTRAVMLYYINRPEGNSMTFAEHIDPKYAKLAAQAKQAGVEFRAIRFQYLDGKMHCQGDVPIQFKEGL